MDALSCKFCLIRTFEAFNRRDAKTLEACEVLRTITVPVEFVDSVSRFLVVTALFPSAAS